MNSDSIVVGIDASRNRSGGAIAHLKGIIKNFDYETNNIIVHVWTYKKLLDDLPNYTWLIKHHHPFLERSLLHQLIWQLFCLRREAVTASCNIIFSTDASTFTDFEPLVVLSQDLLSYEPGVMSKYGFSKARFRLEIIRYIQNFAFRRAQGVLFLTKYASKLVQNSCGPLSNYAFAPHGIDDSFRLCKSIEKRDIDWSSQKEINCVYVSNADLYKHQWNVVHAIYELRQLGKPLKLTLIGGGSGIGKILLDKAIENCDPRREFVTQLEFTKHSELPSHLRTADLYIFASSCENLPVTLLEGMAAGLPIACSNRGPMPEVLGSGGVYFDPESITSIQNCLFQIIDSKLLRTAIVDEAIKISNHYTWKNCSNLTFKFIRECYKRWLVTQ